MQDIVCSKGRIFVFARILYVGLPSKNTTLRYYIIDGINKDWYMRMLMTTTTTTTKKSIWEHFLFDFIRGILHANLGFVFYMSFVGLISSLVVVEL